VVGLPLVVPAGAVGADRFPVHVLQPGRDAGRLVAVELGAELREAGQAGLGWRHDVQGVHVWVRAGFGQPVALNGVWSSGGTACRCASSPSSYTVYP
jgi:hypothetical protein